MEIGFLGLGAMGAAMAANVLKAGHQLRVWNRSAGPVETLMALGAQAAASPAGAFNADIVCSMLADDAAVRAVVLESGALQNARPGTVHVNFATISVALAGELAEAHRKAGVGYVAAPVFGRPNVAAAAALQIVAAGDAGAIDRVQPLLDRLGEKTWRVGTMPHHANIVKIAGNFMIAGAVEALGEASALVEAYDVAAPQFIDLMTATIFACPVYKNYGPQIRDRRYEPPGFALKLGLKDVRLALQAGDSAAVPMPLASVARDNLLDAIAHGDGNRDWAAMAEVSRRRAGTPKA